MDSDISTTNNLLWYNNLVPMVVYSPFKRHLKVRYTMHVIQDPYKTHL